MTGIAALADHADRHGWYTQQRPDGICGGTYLYAGRDGLGVHCFYDRDGQIFAANLYRITHSGDIRHIGETAVRAGCTPQQVADTVAGWVELLPAAYPTRAAS